jgi:hypothetical protein
MILSQAISLTQVSNEMQECFGGLGASMRAWRGMHQLINL